MKRARIDQRKADLERLKAALRADFLAKRAALQVRLARLTAEGTARDARLRRRQCFLVGEALLDRVARSAAFEQHAPTALAIGTIATGKDVAGSFAHLDAAGAQRARREHATNAFRLGQRALALAETDPAFASELAAILDAFVGDARERAAIATLLRP